ncbi:MAG: hypothetical protein ABRQ26_07755 [Syntrophomonadaceae bacterium]
MKHYSAEEWSAFYRKEASLDLLAMEDHLLECDKCLELFLLALEQADLKSIEQRIPADFTQTTGQRLRSPVVLELPRKDFKPRWLAANYVAAAILTVMLMGGGVFQTLALKASEVPVRHSPNYSQKINSFLSSWPEQLMDSTWGRIEKLHTLDGKEVKR